MVFSARLRKPQDGLFCGSIDALDTVNNSYRVTFERNGLGTHSIPDYEVLVSSVAWMSSQFHMHTKYHILFIFIPIFHHIYAYLLMFIHNMYSFTCLLIFIHINSYLFIFTHSYSCSFIYTNVYSIYAYCSHFSGLLLT